MNWEPIIQTTKRSGKINHLSCRKNNVLFRSDMQKKINFVGYKIKWKNGKKYKQDFPVGVNEI